MMLNLSHNKLIFIPIIRRILMHNYKYCILCIYLFAKEKSINKKDFLKE